MCDFCHTHAPLVAAWPPSYALQAILTKEDGGHVAPVHALVAGPGTGGGGGSGHLFSADRLGDILVWDMAGSGRPVQRLAGSHGGQPIMQMLAFEVCRHLRCCV
jgi:hypothetical protein